MTVLQTTCPLDCPDSCGLDITVSDDVVTKISGSRSRHLTDGFICSKVSRFAERVRHSTRLTSPARRVGKKGDGEFAPISWPEAIATITAKFSELVDRHGGETILPYHYGGSNGVLTEGFTDDLYFARLGASRLAKTVCATPTTEVAVGMYGKMPGVAFEDFAEARCIVVWGANPKASNIHLMPYLKAAKRRGAFVAVVDPVRNLSSSLVDLHLPVRPGTDLPVALAMINFWHGAALLDGEFLGANAKSLERLLERASAWSIPDAAAVAGIDPHALEVLARTYAESSPALIRCGWGLERNRNGGQAVAAVLALPALLGKFAVRGGGYTLSNNGAARVNTGEFFDLSSWRTRVLNMTELGRLLTETLAPPLSGLFVYNCNPAATVPDQNRILKGLRRDDLFTVVFEQVMTDTALFADILLPATTFLEHRDLRVPYGNYALGGVCPVVSPFGEARSNHWVFGALGRAMGFEDDVFHWDEERAFRALAQALTMNGSAVNLDLLSGGGAQRYDFPGTAPVQFDTVHPRTADAKIDLCPDVLGADAYHFRAPSTNGYPLSLISPATSKLVSSTMGEYNLPELWVRLNPVDATERRIKTGDAVRVFNDLGAVECTARVATSIREGVVQIPKGAWRFSSRNGQTATALCPATTDNVGGGACFNDARVQVESI